MKKLIPLLLAVLLLAGCAETYDGPTEVQPRLVEYTAVHYYQFFNFTEQVQTYRTVYAYDIYGNQVEYMAYRDDELYSVTKLRYDDRGNEVSRTEWDHSGWIPKFDSRTERTYDDQGRLLSYVSRNFWGSQESASRYTYDDENRSRTYRDENGEVLQTTWFDADGNKLRQTAGDYETIYEYDGRGNMTGWVSYENGQPHERCEYRYDDRDRQIWWGRYNAAGNLKSEANYVFDDEANSMSYEKSDGGRRVEYYHSDGRPMRIEDYDSDGRLSLIQYYTYRDIQVPADREE